MNLRTVHKPRYANETIDSENAGAHTLMTENQPHLFGVNCCEASRSGVKRVVDDGSTTPNVDKNDGCLRTVATQSVTDLALLYCW